MRGCLSAWCLFSLLAACRVAPVAPTPVAGAAPTTLAVWPRLDAEVAGAGVAAGVVAAEVLLPLDGAMRRRGYQVPSTAVVQRLLADRGHLAAAPDAEALAMLTELVGAEAVMVLELRHWETEGEPLRHARWDLSWRLVAASESDPARLVERWSHTHHGAWQQASPDPLGLDALARHDGTTFPAHRSVGAPSYRSAGELLAALHRMAMEHLPPRAR